MPGTDREDVQLENIRGRPLKIQHHTAQHSPKIVDEAKREGESTESESITEAENETDVEAEVVAESAAECRDEAEVVAEYEAQL